ncbi:unnamed protein product [Anisakis simplex]|uniref:NIDO domain-containing protein n=1 Tax=Anisakis simplex TaxID=6269 RepID=A0A0M3J6W3_ANISI|nr:unnamed protein product [Anisakis simplex]
MKDSRRTFTQVGVFRSRNVTFSVILSFQIFQSSEGNLFQIALIYSESGTFAHVVYSKLISNNDAIAGFSGQDDHYSLPESGTHDAIQLAEKSDIGIPGEFVFRIDADRVFLCGAGFKVRENEHSFHRFPLFKSTHRLGVLLEVLHFQIILIVSI